MVCPHCQDAEKVFSNSYAQRDLDAYRNDGAKTSTQLLLDAVQRVSISGDTLLDIGGGVGAIPLALLESHTVNQAVDVDASQAYIAAAQDEASRRGVAESITYQHGDFVQLAPTLSPAAIVTLDRVICCYPDVEALVNKSSALAQEVYAVVYPRDNWLFKAVIPVFNFLAFRLWGNQFRTYIHDSSTIERIVQANGFSPVARRTTWLWQVRIWRR